MVMTLGLISIFLVMNGSTVVSPLPVALGERISLNTSGDAELKTLLKKHAIMYTSIEAAHADYIITLETKQQVIVTKKKDIGEQISSLQVILPRLTMEGRDFRKLDLRFDKPVVTY